MRQFHGTVQSPGGQGVGPTAPMTVSFWWRPLENRGARTRGDVERAFEALTFESEHNDFSPERYPRKMSTFQRWRRFLMMNELEPLRFALVCEAMSP